MTATRLAEFFTRFREQSVQSDEKFRAFFRRFDAEYREQRKTRAASTPHLDVLRVFGLEFAELRHSDAFAWFLDPRGEHEQGALFANAVLGLFDPKVAASERYTVRRERHGRTDVAFYARGEFAVFVENKVRHFEREEQVSDMVKSLVRRSKELDIPPRRRFALFLTDTGAEPVTGPAEDTAEFPKRNLQSRSRVALFEDLRAALVAQPVYSPLLLQFLDSYLHNIRRVRAQLT